MKWVRSLGCDTASADEKARRAFELREGLPRRLALRLVGIHQQVSGHVLVEAGRPDEARASFEEARQRFEEAEDLAQAERVAAELAAFETS